MQAMTATPCPVCATPYEPGAAKCAFCGVSLVEPEPKPAAKTKTRARPAPKAADPGTPAKESKSPPPTKAVERSADESPSPTTIASAETVASDAGQTPAPASVESVEIVAPSAERTPAPAAVESVERSADEIPSPPPAAVDDIASAAENEPQPPSAGIVENSGIPAESALSAPLAPGAQAPSFARARIAASAAQRRMQRIEWGVVAALALLLLVQVVASDFDQLAASPATRPWLQATCNALRCSLPPWREPQALHLLQRDVRANPQRPGSLRISASFRNDARWAQPWPRLRVTLSDTDGRAIAARDFAASEYLGARATANGIASGQVASIAFDVADPSPRVTAFTFEFR
jgi:hypothetical protein